MHRKRSILYVSLLSPIVIVFVLFLSIRSGSTSISSADIFEAIFAFDANNVTHNIVITSRVPRAIGAMLIGALLAMSGALMQGMTRNYLASPSIMGVSDGAGFVITLAVIFLPGMSSLQMMMFSLIGSAVGVGIVFGLASLIRNGFSPVKLAIIGTIIGTFLSSLSAAFATYFQVSQTMSFWYNARLHQINPGLLLFSIPFATIGIILALFLSNSISILSLGEETSASLGQRKGIVKGLTILSVVIMTGISVALVGKIGFVGLIIPHITRFLIGRQYKIVIPIAGIFGGVFLTLCDSLSLYMNYPFETPVGVVTAIIGVPFFLYLIKTKGGAQHD
ncbi:iron ABC transporter permease [Bacillus sp. AFS040349]|uniref:FecCD family ABC transporter permease n=1 Tax=Bacillus sp. AFS040349 TaxID=2033502 RepID=UPI000BFC9ED7|nr:iron ABC transporter permease [Bacillus sp. AFS040349]PGT76569.1 ferrichrome ABC transporter permease [Bacillus sp. AFS040349]